MKDNNPLKVILIAAIFAVAAFTVVSLLPDQENCAKKTEQLSECKRSESLPDIELMRNAAARAKDIFSIVSKPIIQ